MCSMCADNAHAHDVWGLHCVSCIANVPVSTALLYGGWTRRRECAVLCCVGRCREAVLDANY